VAEPEPKQLITLEKELSYAISDFDKVIAEQEEKNEKEVKEIGEADLTALLDKIEPLLRKGDIEAVGYADKLQNIAGMEELAALIDDYDFMGALEILIKLNNR
jgi:hypothetical protein